MGKNLELELNEVGQELASLWGACCIDFEINHEEKSVTFFCMECDEEFATVLSFEQIEKDYNVKVA